LNTGSSNKKHYPALDGLRGVAILLVVFLHNFRFLNYFFFGWLGVDLFFVLSGFLITDILLDTLDKPHFLKNFYMRRILRIFPLYYFILIICLLILPHIKTLQLNLNYYTNNQVWLWTYLQNWLYTLKEPFGSQMLLHLWSLAVEEQFYLIWPITILLIRRPKILFAVMTVVLLMVAVIRFVLWSYHIGELAYSSLYTFTRIDGICVGCMLALLMRINPGFLKKYTSLVVFFIAILNFGFYFLNHQHAYALPYLAFVGYTTFAILFGILVYEAVIGESKIINFLFNNRILKFFGKISYGLYIYHWPVYILLFEPIQHSLFHISVFNEKTSFITASVAVTIVSILISFLSYEYFEKSFLKLKNKYS
jgi:peptidoglycan/LPS O-acetylase OafA/YrhL